MKERRYSKKILIASRGRLPAESSAPPAASTVAMRWILAQPYAWRWPTDRRRISCLVAEKSLPPHLDRKRPLARPGCDAGSPKPAPLPASINRPRHPMPSRRGEEAVNMSAFSRLSRRGCLKKLAAATERSAIQILQSRLAAAVRKRALSVKTSELKPTAHLSENTGARPAQPATTMLSRSGTAAP